MAYETKGTPLAEDFTGNSGLNASGIGAVAGDIVDQTEREKLTVGGPCGLNSTASEL